MYKRMGTVCPCAFSFWTPSPRRAAKTGAAEMVYLTKMSTFLQEDFPGKFPLGSIENYQFLCYIKKSTMVFCPAEKQDFL